MAYQVGPFQPFPAFQQGAAPPYLLANIPNLRERLNTGTHQLDVSQYFLGADTYAISPSIEAGWSFDTNTGLLTVDTDAVGNFGPFTITATNAEGDTDSNAFSVEIYAVLSEGGSAKRKHRKRYFVEIDGQYFEVDSQAEAVERVLKRAEEIAQNVAEKATVRNAKRIKRGRKIIPPGTPKITSSPELATVVDEYRERIESIYRQIAIDAEIRELMRLKLLEEDEDDALFVLLH